MYGELIPSDGGDPIPLTKKKMRVGRREGCDIVLNYGNVSGHHCLLEINLGYWFVTDLNSRNGVKVNGKRVAAKMRKRLDPDVEITIGKRQFEIKYNPTELGAYGSPPQDEDRDNMPGGSLLD